MKKLNNYIWFIVSILPILLLFFYAIGFFNNEDLRSNQDDNYTLTLNTINGYTLKEVNNLQQTYIDTNTLGTINDNGYYVSNEIGIHTLRFQLYTLGSEGQYIYDDSILIDNDFYYLAFLNNINDTFTFDIYIRFSYSDNGTITTSYNYDTSNVFLNNNYFQLDVSSWYQNSKTYLLNNYNNVSITNLYISFYKTSASANNFLEYYPILSNEKIFANEHFFNNYKTYVNDFNTIKYNSCPISYTYNGNTYNIETNGNNYLGTGETLDIYQNFNYTLNEQPILNYNNYFISSAIEVEDVSYGSNIGQDININDTRIINLINAPLNEQAYNSNYTYYRIVAGNYRIWSPTSANLENWNSILNNQRIYICKISSFSYIYDYYSIDSTIDTSLNLIPSNNFNDFLTNVNNTFATYGLISNLFISMLSYFSISNVYASLCCYYLEYLILVTLLRVIFKLFAFIPNLIEKAFERKV